MEETDMCPLKIQSFSFPILMNISKCPCLSLQVGHILDYKYYKVRLYPHSPSKAVRPPFPASNYTLGRIPNQA